MNLTDKREHVFHHGTLYEGESIKKIIAEQDKEFIQKLKEEMFMLNPDHFEAIDELNKKNFDKIDKLAGPKLTENST